MMDLCALVFFPTCLGKVPLHRLVHRRSPAADKAHKGGIESGKSCKGVS